MSSCKKIKEIHPTDLEKNVCFLFLFGLHVALQNLQSNQRQVCIYIYIFFFFDFYFFFDLVWFDLSQTDGRTDRWIERWKNEQD